ncbi:hypothetical protein GW17_00055488 [Ensete ventricosum]|nr:hypothetical protein GW17_00055488 [Ensete ventricosum]
MVDKLQLWPPPPILLPPSAQELRDQTRGVPLEGSEEEGRPATANPHAGPATHDQAASRASPKGSQRRPQGAAPAGRSVARGGSSRSHARPAATSPQRGSLARRLPTGKGSCRLHKGDGGAEGERGVRASF